MQTSMVNWNYDESVRRVSAKVKEWKAVTLKKSTLTNEIARDLYEAREQLDNSGYRSDLVPNGTRLTWRQYLADVGLAKSNVHRWLEHFDPQEQRLLTDDEYKCKEQEKQRKQMEHDKAIKHMAQERVKNGYKPADWNNEAEKVYQDMLIQERKHKEWKEKIDYESKLRDERVRKMQEKMKQAKENRRSPTENIDKLLDELSRNIGPQIEERKKFAEQARLTGDNADHGFNQLLRDYLDSLQTDSERLEACHNIIKICKSYVSQYQRKSV